MINLGISIAVIAVITFLFSLLKVHLAIGLPLGIVAGFIVFLLLGRKMQEVLEKLMNQMQRDMQAGKLDRAIETLKKGFAYKWRHIFVARQLNSQIGMLYYLKKDHDLALQYLKKGFLKHYIGQGMLACIYYKRKDMDAMKQALDDLVQANRKESIVYGLYAFLLHQLKDREGAIKKLQAGIKKLPDDQRLITNLNLLQNNKRMKMKVFGDMWVQFMLERAPRIQQNVPPHLRMKRRATFR